jgi:hypothetical protein
VLLGVGLANRDRSPAAEINIPIAEPDETEAEVETV